MAFLLAKTGHRKCCVKGHLITVCLVLSEKESKTGQPPAGVEFINAACTPGKIIVALPDPHANAEVDSRFKPFFLFRVCFMNR